MTYFFAQSAHGARQIPATYKPNSANILQTKGV